MFAKLVRFLINAMLLLVVFFAANFIASFLLGVLTNIGGNVQVVGFNQISFNPLITIAYMILYYYVTLFYQPAPKAQYYLFLLTLFLSFTMSFIQGALFVIAFYWLLRKIKMI